MLYIYGLSESLSLLSDLGGTGGLIGLAKIIIIVYRLRRVHTEFH